MKSITHKIILLAISVALIMGLTIGLIVNYMISKSAQEDIDLKEQIMYSNYDLLIRAEVETVVSIIQAIDTKIQKGELTPTLGKKLATDIVRDLRYDKEGYFWIDTKEGLNLVLLGRDSEGKNRMNLQDAKGKFLIQDIINNGLKEGGGYSEYWFPKKAGGEPLLKRSYSLSYSPFEWVIGTGNYIDDIEQTIEQTRIEKRNAITKMRITIIVLISIIVILTSIVAVIIGRRISNPIKHLEANVALIAQGDLTVTMNTQQKDEVGRLSQSLTDMSHKLREIISTIHTGAENVVIASRQLNATAEVISINVNKSASSTEEVSASMEQMASNVNQNLSNAAETEKIAIKTVNQIEQVYKAFIETVDSLNKIAKKINIVNEIAERTDLLAINAAIEAARAGLQGKGFSVVATEVRSLAERSRNSAIEIEELSTKIVQTANNSFAMLEEAIPNIKRNATLVEEIKAANNEFNAGIEQINSAIQQLVNVTQTNASISEQLSSNSSQLESQSHGLKHTISFFQLQKDSNQKATEQQNKQLFDAFMQMYANYLNTNPNGSVETFSKQIKIDHNTKTEVPLPKKQEVKLNMDKEDDNFFEKY